MYSRREKFNKKNRHFHKRSKFQSRHHPQKKEYRHQDQLTDVEVGITEYISNLEGFSGIIKARYSDFHVNEVNLDGEVAKLTNTGVPPGFLPKVESLSYKDVMESPLKELLPQDIWEGIKNLLESDESEPVKMDAENLSKEERTQIHQCIRDYFKQKIVANTVVVDNKKHMEFKKFNKDGKIECRFRWPENIGEYVYFLVYKEAIDTMDACLKISDCLKMSPANFTYAGVKDKRAKTTQWFCVRKVEPWKLMKKTKPLRNVKIGNFTYKDVPLKLGQLQGNLFRIALRNITGSDDLIQKSMEHIKEHGFINYYGLQRFGNDKEAPTYEIGFNLLLGKWREAVQLILKQKTSDDPADDVSKAKKLYAETGDAEKAYEMLEKNKNRCVEARLLEGLKKGNDNDYVNALETIPRNMRLLYIHSSQSLIWNKMVSKRLQLFGMKPVEGDLVLVNKGEDQPENQLSGNSEGVDEKEEEEEGIKCKLEVKALTADEVSNYTIYDIVLTLPGYDVIYPENLKQYYKQALEDHGLSLEMTKQRVKTYTLCGDYRKILEKTKDLSWKIMHYNNPTDNLIRSDFEELKGEPEPKSVEGGRYKALVMEFNLPASCYATMMLREVLKTNTSSSAQALLNNYHDAKQEKKKIVVVDQADDEDKSSETCEIAQSSSLLSNPGKYEEFKNSIFNCVESTLKRKSEGELCEEEEDSKKARTDKKEEEAGIKMEASLV